MSRPLDPAAVAHFVAILTLLSRYERARIQRLPCDEFRALIEDLAPRPISDAIARCRFVLASRKATRAA